jgi:hypothetical protein
MKGTLIRREVWLRGQGWFVDDLFALNPELSFHADKFVDVAKDDCGDLFPDVLMVAFRHKDFLVGNLDLGLELFVIQRSIHPMKLFHQLNYCVID